MGALCVRALGKEKVVGILMPASHTPKKDMEDARILAEGWGVKTFEVRIDPIFSALVRALPLRGDDKIAKANAKARIRMIINYYLANLLGMVVAGTGSRRSLSSFIMLYQTLWSCTPMISLGITPSSIGATC